MTSRQWNLPSRRNESNSHVRKRIRARAVFTGTICNFMNTLKGQTCRASLHPSEQLRPGQNFSIYGHERGGGGCVSRNNLRGKGGGQNP